MCVWTEGPRTPQAGGGGSLLSSFPTASPLGVGGSTWSRGCGPASPPLSSPRAQGRGGGRRAEGTRGYGGEMPQREEGKGVPKSLVKLGRRGQRRTRTRTGSGVLGVGRRGKATPEETAGPPTFGVLPASSATTAGWTTTRSICWMPMALIWCCLFPTARSSRRTT